MLLEADVLRWIHQWASRPLDAFFLVSHELGRTAVQVGTVLAIIAWHLAVRRPKRALAWFGLGLLVFFLIDGPKAAVGRERPLLWPRVVEQGGESFPSEHALGSAALFPLIAWEAARRWPRRAVPAYTLAVAGALWLGIGRLYLGVHWPSDVLAGWCAGAVWALVAWAALWRLEGGRTPDNGR